MRTDPHVANGLALLPLDFEKRDQILVHRSRVLVADFVDIATPANGARLGVDIRPAK